MARAGVVMEVINSARALMGLPSGAGRSAISASPDIDVNPVELAKVLRMSSAATDARRLGATSLPLEALGDEPVQTDTNRRRLEHRSLDDHAWALHLALLGSAFDGCEFTPSEYGREKYEVECTLRGWWNRPWNPVVRRYRELFCGGMKIYREYEENGRRRRVAGLLIPSRRVSLAPSLTEPEPPPRVGVAAG